MATQQIPTIDVAVREHLGTRYARRLRKQGRLPAVIYGHKIEPVHISVDEHELSELLHHNAHLVEVQMDKKNEPCLIKDVQWNHLGSQIIHIDLARVKLTERITVSVALKLLGEAVGLKEAGALLEHPINEIAVECLASQIPEQITADISELDVGQTVTIGDVQLPDGVTTTLEPETVIASIRIMAEEPEEEELVVAAEEGEPQIIGKPEGEDEPAGEEKKKEDG